MFASRPANFSAWRRWTRPATAEAVPATTAVRATPRSSPGIAVAPSARRFEGLEGGHDLGRRDAGAGDDLSAAPAGSGDERCRPRVLVDDQCRDGAGRHGTGGLADVVLAEQARPRAAEVGEAARGGEGVGDLEDLD